MAGCATTEYNPLPRQPEKQEKPQPQVEKKPEGIYHKVEKGQTLWRIAKTYGVSVDDITTVNHIPNAAAVEVNQLLLIPGAKAAKEISPAHTEDENKDEFIWPVKGKVISYFNDRRGEAANHGLDIEVNEGDPVKAAREGTVVMADNMPGYGQTLMIDHGDGFLTVYAQNRKLLFHSGDHVHKGDPVAEAGRIGRRSFIHFEMRRAGTAVNPLYYLP